MKLTTYILTLATWAIFATTATIAAAADISVVVSDRALSVPLPRGYCLLDERHPADTRITEFLRKGVEPLSRFHFAFADCEQLTDWHRGGRKVLDDYGYVANSVGEEKIDFTGRTQSELNGLIRRSLANFQEPLMALGTQMVEKAIDDADLRIKLQGAELIGVLEESSNGFFLGMLVSFVDEFGDQRVSAGVGNSLLVNSRSIFGWVYKPHDGTRSVLDVLATQKAWAADIIEANQ